MTDGTKKAENTIAQSLINIAEKKGLSIFGKHTKLFLSKKTIGNEEVPCMCIASKARANSEQFDKVCLNVPTIAIVAIENELVAGRKLSSDIIMVDLASEYFIDDEHAHEKIEAFVGGMIAEYFHLRVPQARGVSLGIEYHKI